MPEKLENIELRSEEVQEILTRVPNWMIRWGNTLFLSLIVIVLVMAWFIKYPDIIQTTAFLTTENPAEKIYARSTSRIDSIFVEANQQVFSGQPLALLENTANYSDIVFLDSLLDTMEVSENEFFFPIDDLPLLFLGEVEQAYANFENSYISYSINKNLRPYSNEAKAQQLKLSELKLQVSNLESQIRINKKELEFKENDLERMNTLYDKGVIAEQEYETRQIEFLQAQRNYENLINLRSQLRDAINATSSNSRSTDINRTRESLSLSKALIQSFNQLKKSIKDWKYVYLLEAEQPGKVTFMNYWNTNQTANQGDVIFTVIPNDSKGYLAKLTAPAQNSGKIKTGQTVNINLANYPENEFGVLKGTIRSVSALPDEEQNYIIDVSLPDSLVTTYGKPIDYKPEMPGSAEIITEDLRLLERLFIQFKQLLDR
ncbi:HlyD family secretion protein [Leeuwenhoekiella sp. H156]|uniref:HlyD family secretion protein n=1 Tax=Leeuwenhoekiella sp. H156 TaxID=3450128 RepID=UPI003FA4275B